MDRETKQNNRVSLTPFSSNWVPSKSSISKGGRRGLNLTAKLTASKHKSQDCYESVQPEVEQNYESFQRKKVLHGRFEFFGHQNVGKETLISKILMTGSSVGQDNLGYLTIHTKDAIISLKNMEKKLSTNDTLVECDGALAPPDPDVCVVMFSLLNRSSFQYAKRKVQDLRRQHNGQIAILLIGNKADAIQSRRVPSKEAGLVARIHECQYLETAVIYPQSVTSILGKLMDSVQSRDERNTSVLRNIQRCVRRCFLPRCFKKLTP